MNRHGFACHRGLIYHSVTRNDLAVKRYHRACSDYYHIALVYFVDRHEDFLTVGSFCPHLFYSERHGTGKVVNGLPVCPFVEDISHIQQEHHRACGLEIAAEK